jgi:hypothetical protein
MDNHIKFKIELTAKTSSRKDISYIYEEISSFIDSISHMFYMADITTTMINEKNAISKIEEDKETVKEEPYEDNNFDKYINSLPKFNKKREILALRYIKDYLIKNRSAKLTDIIKGCQEQGFTSKSDDPKPAFYLRLKKLVDSGKVIKKNKIYIWKYTEND